MNFTQLNLITPVLKALDKNNLENPTPIQEQIIPLILENNDVIWLAKTWSWKTLSFLLPFLNNLYLFKKENWILESKDKKIRFLIIAPTRELAIQIGESIWLFSNNLHIKYDTIFWWVNQFHQEKSINKWLDVLVATPWRLIDLLNQKIVNLRDVKYLVLDEADKMLDMWFINDIEKILKFVPKEIQTSLFSATMPERINNLAKNILKNPKIVKISNSWETEEKISQNAILVEDWAKIKAVKSLLSKFKGSTIIFVNTKDDCDMVFWKIKQMWFKADYIHRNRSQNARQNAIKAIKNWEINVLVATDIASRWIDIDWLDLVINYSLPKEAEVYVHRIWRTARAWKSWIAYSLVSKAEDFKFEIIKDLIKTDINIDNDKSFHELIVPKWEFLWSFNNDKTPNKKRRYYKK